MVQISRCSYHLPPVASPCGVAHVDPAWVVCSDGFHDELVEVEPMPDKLVNAQSAFEVSHHDVGRLAPQMLRVVHPANQLVDLSRPESAGDHDGTKLPAQRLEHVDGEVSHGLFLLKIRHIVQVVLDGRARTRHFVEREMLREVYLFLCCHCRLGIRKWWIMLSSSAHL